ncbi:MAG: DUF3592 domain-containing protein [Chitinophagaceae bacterium]|nr:DUF3592 domain-containing protein [Chitinophagaceae bacterium]MCA6495859.1 DUF3592 domain-containing protein [Chitinophagaceae bacterium]MCA6499198.1 DUF3592 domain-containing protein [Chitinophagaceae bacterium]
MTRTLVILFLVCYGAYLITTRQPDFFDGERVPATITLVKSKDGLPQPFAVYHTGYQEYKVNALYPLLDYREGDKVEVIYEASMPSKGTVYHWWGYWFRWQELIPGLVIFVVLFQVAKALTNNPTPEALLEQIEYKEEPKRKYIE